MASSLNWKRARRSLWLARSSPTIHRLNITWNSVIRQGSDLCGYEFIYIAITGRAATHASVPISLRYAAIFVFATLLDYSTRPWVWGERGRPLMMQIPKRLSKMRARPLNSLPLSIYTISGGPKHIRKMAKELAISDANLLFRAKRVVYFEK